MQKGTEISIYDLPWVAEFPEEERADNIQSA
jgi:hypothetical protein